MISSSGSERDVPSADEVPVKFTAAGGEYLLSADRLGSGSFGSVLAGVQIGSRTPVAIKWAKLKNEKWSIITNMTHAAAGP